MVQHKCDYSTMMAFLPWRFSNYNKMPQYHTRQEGCVKMSVGVPGKKSSAGTLTCCITKYLPPSLPRTGSYSMNCSGDLNCCCWKYHTTRWLSPAHTETKTRRRRKSSGNGLFFVLRFRQRNRYFPRSVAVHLAQRGWKRRFLCMVSD